MKRSVVVTGASTGIGFTVAKRLASEGFHVFGSVRKTEDADRLSADIGDEITPLVFDVTDPEGVAEAARDVAQRLGTTTLAGLVNNAGIATMGPLLHQPIDEIRHQLEVNVTAQVAVTQAFAPLLGADRARTGPPGRIVNMSSVGGRIASPFLGAYGASKHAMEAISNSLRCELLIYGIDVVVIEPGSIVTPIWDKADAADYSTYDNTDYRDQIARLRKMALKLGRSGLPPDRVADAVLRALRDPNPPARIQVVKNRLQDWIAPRLLPDRVLDRIIGKMMGLKRIA